MFTLDTGVQLETRRDVVGSAGDADLPAMTVDGALLRRPGRMAVCMLVLSTIGFLMAIAGLGVGLLTNGGTRQAGLVDTADCVVSSGSEKGPLNASSCPVLVEPETEASRGARSAGLEGAPPWSSVISSSSVHVPVPRLWTGLAGRLLSPVGGL